MNVLKRCSCCGIELGLEEFNRCASKRLGVQSRCRSCCQQQFKNYYLGNKDKYLERVRKFREKRRTID